jgi:hypothetical protein
MTPPSAFGGCTHFHFGTSMPLQAGGVHFINFRQYFVAPKLDPGAKTKMSWAEIVKLSTTPNPGIHAPPRPEKPQTPRPGALAGRSILKFDAS